MNKNGWGLRVELAFILLFLFCLIIATIGVSRLGLLRNDETGIILENNNSDNYSYIVLENKLKDATKSYYNDKYGTNTSDSLIISSNTLISNGYMSRLYDGNNRECKGYSKVFSGGVITSYVRCSKYHTVGYERSYE